MSWQRPSLSRIRERVRADFKARIPGGDALLRHSNLRVAADIHAGLSHEHHGFQAWLARQVIPDTAEGRWLERWAFVVFGLQRTAASRAEGQVVFEGTDGSAIPEGTEVQRSDRVRYTVTEGATITDGAATLPVRAVEPGADGNADGGTTLRLVSAIAGVDAEGAVHEDGIAGGADEESDAELLDRLILRVQETPQGGAETDYVQWALAVEGVTRAWVAPQEMGPGTVTVRFMMDEVRADQDGIPQGDGHPDYTEDLKAVFDYINERRPVTAELFVAAPVAVALDIVIADLDPDTPENREAIAREIKDMIRREAEPGGTIPISKIWEAIAVAEGVNSFTLVSPTEDVTHDTGEIAIPGEVTYE